MSGTPFALIPYLTSLVVSYGNDRADLVADRVFPRVPVGAQSFRYLKFGTGDGFTIPDTKVGRTGEPGQVEFAASPVDSSTLDYALDAPVPNSDKENAVAAGFDPEARAAAVVADLILLDREVRAATLLFNAANYGTNNKTTLTNPWSDKTNGDPIGDITTARDAMIRPPNVMVLGKSVATALQKHPEIVESYSGSAETSGLVPLSFLAKLFDLDEVIIGQAWYNTAKPGQTVSLSRSWGKFAALIYRNPAPINPENANTFGFTAQFGSRIAGRIDEPNMGMRGGVKIRVGESVREVIMASDLGYLFSNAAA